jgi:hypothetical protein
MASTSVDEAKVCTTSTGVVEDFERTIRACVAARGVNELGYSWAYSRSTRINSTRTRIDY